MSSSTAASKDSRPALVMTGREWLLLGILSLIWGSGFLFTRIAVRDIPPATLVAIRVVLAAALMYPVVRRRRMAIPDWTWRAWRPFFIMGLMSIALPFTLNAWGLTRIESSLAGILVATTPVFTVMIAHFATDDERFSVPVALGVGFGLAGVIAIVGADPKGLTSGSGLATVALLISAFLYAGSGVYARTLRGTPPVILTWAQLSASTIMVLPLALFERPWDTVTWSSDSVVSTAILTLGTVAAYLLYFRILGRAGAVNTSLVAYVIPVIAVLLGVTFLDESLLPQQIVGTVLVLAAMGLIDGRLVRWLVSRKANPADLPAD
jgi:drug/metabolite transporter (DMT)-like permease